MNANWELKPFGEVCEIIGGSQPPKSTFIYESKEGYIRLVQVRDYRTDKFKTYIPLEKARKFCTKDDIMIGRYGPPIFGIFKGLEGAYNVALMKAVPNENILNKEFLYWFLKTDKLIRFVEKSSKRAAGQDGVRKELLYKYPTPVPPIEEQKQIVEILDKAFESIEQAKANIEKNIENTKELFQSRLNEIFSQKGEGWEEKTLGEVCEMIKRGISPKYIETDGLIVINQKCIRNHKIDLSLSRLHNSTLKSVNNERIIKVGDVLINSTGTGTLGRIAQVRDIELEGCTVDSHVTIVRPCNDLFYLDFFGYALIKIEKEIENSGEGTSGQTELSRMKLQNDFIINYPSNLKKQQEIVLILDSLKTNLKNLEQHYKQKLKNLEELKKSILQKAFSGELLK